jgi:hypothetical protein
MTITMRSSPAGAREMLQLRCEGLVAAEMARLAGRVPALNGAHRLQVHEALGRLVDELVLSRAHAVRDDQLALMFDLAGIR